MSSLVEAAARARWGRAGLGVVDRRGADATAVEPEEREPGYEERFGHTTDQIASIK